jgi:DNA-binding PadR family transcriptional regulator
LNNKIKKEIVQRLNKNFLDILILRLIESEPIWGYRIIKKTREFFGLKLGHGALYPLLKFLETKGYTKSEKVKTTGRIRKIYHLTEKGKEILDIYYYVLGEQLKKNDFKDD